jgi:hypothetical protein
MAQHDYNIANATFPATRSDINSVLSAINTSNSGTSRPSSAVEGTVWLDTTNATTPTLKFYDGSDDISLATLDYTANTVNWIDSTVVFDIVNDLSPQLGGNLDLNSNDITGTGDINITGDVTATSFSGDGSALTGIETGTDWQSTIVTGTTLTALAGKGYWIDTTSNQCTITFPSSASVGDTIELVDYARTWGTNKIIIDSNGLNYQGSPDTDTVEYDTSGQALRVVYSGATKGWIPTSDEVSEDNPVTPSYDIDFLVIAGGGGGGARAGGGGGAGGYRASYNSESSGGGGSSESALTVTPTTQYTVTVGAGGAGGSFDGDDGDTGSNSVFATITSNGGGKGDYNSTGGSGGSGGGGGGFSGTVGGSGTANQGFNGGNGTGGANYGGGGGGGAGSAGGSQSIGGNGGNGVASTITGSSVTRGGGGGGTGSTGGTGGSGGGGNGSPVQGNRTAGTVNTGGGGGGGWPASLGGGSGVVILRMPTASYSGTTTGSPTVTTSGSDTILTYTGSGSYTA